LILALAISSDFFFFFLHCNCIQNAVVRRAVSAEARAWSAQCRGQEIAVCIFRFLWFWMDDLTSRGLKLIFISL
jgi:hypothetical protein